jgi:hypothetical protein
MRPARTGPLGFVGRLEVLLGLTVIGGGGSTVLGGEIFSASRRRGRSRFAMRRRGVTMRLRAGSVFFNGVGQ